MENHSIALATLGKLLGEPFCSGQSYAIYQADCLISLRALPGQLVDLTVTSPPYNIGKEYEEPAALADYVAWCKAWMDEIHRVTKPGGAFWLNLGFVTVAGKARPLP